MIRTIESPANPYLKELVKLRKSPSGDRFFLEGTRFVEELPHECILEVFTSDPEKHRPFLETLPEETPVFHLSRPAMEKLCTAVSGQTLACTLRKTPCPRPDRLILLDRVQDPGNVGTVIRTAYAFDFGVILSPGCANPWSEKTLMATAGAFRNCYVEQCNSLSERIDQLKHEGFSVFATALDPTAKPPQEITYGQKRAVIIGSEGQGISPDILAAAHQTVFIPMVNPINSLNAASAASIMIYTLREPEKGGSL